MASSFILGLVRFLAVLFNTIAFVFVLLLLLAGTNNGLTSFYYLKTDTTNFIVSSQLASSSFLRDLSTISGTDWVGHDTTAASLGLAPGYTINLLTACALPASGPACSPPHVGFTATPATDLRLDTVAGQSPLPPAYATALASYAGRAPALSGLYVAAELFLALAAALAGLSARGTAAAAALLGALATVLLLAAGVLAGTTFKTLADAINAAFADDGLTAATGRLALVVGYGAVALAGAGGALLGVRAACGGAAAPRKGLAGGAAGAGVKKAGGFLAALPVFGKKARYMEIGKQPAIASTRAVATGHGERGGVGPAGHGGKGGGQVDSDEESVQRRLDARMEEDWAAEDEFAAGGNGAVAMRSLGAGGGGQKRTLDTHTAYEPYSNAI